MNNKYKCIALGLAVLPLAVSAQGEKSLPDSAAQKVNVAFHTIDKKDLMGGISSVDMVELTHKNYTTYSLDNMDAYVGGYNGQLWNQGSALILVDGVPRDASNVMPTEIENITFLKSASAVVLYGSRAAKGVILITTKRGHQEGLQVSVRGNATLMVPKRYPKYLGAAEYMQLYNEAATNDGLTAPYSDETIYHYASGENKYRYPDLNFFSDDFVKKSCQRYDGTAEFAGGGKFAHFYANIGLIHANDLMNFGEGKDNYTNRLNVRGNVDLKLNDWISGYVNANATFYDARGDRSNYWAASATLRPTSEYGLTPLIPISFVDPNNAVAQNYIKNTNYLIDGQYLPGGTQDNQTNPFAAMYAAGYNKYTSRSLQFDAGINFDLDKVLQGLSFKTKFAVDYATSYNTAIQNDYATYFPTWTNANGKDEITNFTKYGTDKRTGTQVTSGSTYEQTVLFQAQFDYLRTFANDHHVNATLLANGYQQSNSGVYHHTTNANLGLQLGYNYQQKYYVDFSAAAIHSAKLAEGHRNAISPVVSLAWRLKGEDFLKDAAWLDDLKLTTSYGVINQDIDISDYYMYSDIFTATGDWWGWSESANSMQNAESQRGGNKELTFIKRKEFRVGLDASVLDGLVTLDANFFTVNTNGLLTQPSTIYPLYFTNYYPKSSYLPYVNYNNQRRTGFDFTVNVHKQLGKVDMNLGVTGMYYTSKNTKWDENVDYEWLRQEGASIETIRGYQCLGFFQDANDVANSAKINNNTKPGDLKYKDQNGDGVIDSKDMVALGKWIAPFTLGINYTAKWNNFTFFLNATGAFGGKGIKNQTTDWVYGSGKYSEAVLGRWTAATAATATYPRLTTQGGELNFVNSDFWLYSTSALYLNKVQITYDFPCKMFQDKLVKGLSIYLSGNSLLTIAKEAKYMETNVGGSPQTRSYNLGVKVNF
jgi:TonB-linked SusC/RagA family outer membrane protein